MWYLIKQHELFKDTAEIINASYQKERAMRRFDYFVEIEDGYFRWIDDINQEAGFLIQGDKKMIEEGYGLILNEFKRNK